MQVSVAGFTRIQMRAAFNYHFNQEYRELFPILLQGCHVRSPEEKKGRKPKQV